MKILYHHRIASKDGQYVHVEEIIKALRGRGHEVVVVEPGSINQKKFGQSSSLVEKIRTHVPGFIHELAEFAYSLLDFCRLSAAITRHRPDVIYERYNLYLPSGIWASKCFGLPLLLEVNSPLYEERKRHGHISMPLLANWTETYVWRHADRALPVTAVLAKRMADKGVNPRKISVIPNGVNRSQFAENSDASPLAQQLGIEGKTVLGFTGFVRDWHRLDRVLEVLRENPEQNWHFMIVGDGPACSELARQASSMGIADKITFTGVVDRADINRYVDCFDIALQPDVVDYASPLKLFEYLAMAKPVLAPDKPNIREVLTHGRTALLFDVENGNDFRDKLLQLCQSAELRQSLSHSARALLDERGYYWDENAARIERLFEHCLESGKMSENP
ncbi:MAG: group 1 glycosyl transferase [Porticoccaceae bacterium]|nr:group 1 glycosyl transferase [Porticoccaceae bacterium]